MNDKVSQFSGVALDIRERPTAELEQVIRLPNSPGATLTRTNTVLSLYFDPDNTPEARAAIREEFVRALAAFPDWAVQRAFDRWTKTGQRRPSPGEIVLLAQREIQPFTDELARRRKIGAEVAQIAADRQPVTPEAAARILKEHGFTADRLAGVMRAKHWSDAVPAGAEGNAELIRKAKEGTL